MRGDYPCKIFIGAISMTKYGVGKGGSWRVVRLQCREEGREGRKAGGGALDHSAVLSMFRKSTTKSLSGSSHQRSLPSLCLPGEGLPSYS